MKVKEFIQFLNTCDPEYRVCLEDTDIEGVIIHTDLVEPEFNCVQLWT